MLAYWQVLVEDCGSTSSTCQQLSGVSQGCTHSPCHRASLAPKGALCACVCVCVCVYVCVLSSACLCVCVCAVHTRPAFPCVLCAENSLWATRRGVRPSVIATRANSRRLRRHHLQTGAAQDVNKAHSQTRFEAGSWPPHIICLRT